VGYVFPSWNDGNKENISKKDEIFENLSWKLRLN
jgi:hypothetical protein